MQTISNRNNWDSTQEEKPTKKGHWFSGNSHFHVPQARLSLLSMFGFSHGAVLTFHGCANKCYIFTFLNYNILHHYQSPKERKFRKTFTGFFVFTVCSGKTITNSCNFSRFQDKNIGRFRSSSKVQRCCKTLSEVTFSSFKIWSILAWELFPSTALAKWTGWSKILVLLNMNRFSKCKQSNCSFV